MRRDLPPAAKIIRLGVTLLDLSPATARQLDMFVNDDAARQRWESITSAIDRLNAKYGKTMVSLGPWTPPPGGNDRGHCMYRVVDYAKEQ